MIHFDLSPSQMSSRGETDGTILDAAEILCARHGANQTAAYTILVQTAVEAGTSVRHVAHAVLAGSPPGPDASMR